MQQRAVLLVLDGWGIGRHDATNPIAIAKPPRISALRRQYLSGALQASGISVGLPWGEEGDSEVGHLTIGAGKVIYQHYPRITLAIRDGSFFENETLRAACIHAHKNRTALHLAGLLTEGNVHASLEHLRALLMLAKKESVPAVYLHLFSDGKDSAPRSLPRLLKTISAAIKEIGIGAIASISGRFYALDRDEHWNNTEKAYRAITGDAPMIDDLNERIHALYQQGLGDDFFEPGVIGPVPHPVQNGDALIFFDFREDSIRALASAFILPDFDKFPRAVLSNLAIATMTKYSEKLKAPVAFPPEQVVMPLGKIIADAGLLQLRIAETEKYAHVTFFFNGYREEPFQNEYRVLIPSKNVSSPALAPEMMTHEIASRVAEAITEKGFHFIVANLAAPDVVAHTGNFDAALHAVGAVDEAVGAIADACLKHNVPLLITSDHGHIEEMMDPFTGIPETKHHASLVPLYLVGHEFERPKNEEEMNWIETEAIGILADVAPTILALMGISKPDTMTGENLLHALR